MANVSFTDAELDALSAAIFHCWDFPSNQKDALVLDKLHKRMNLARSCERNKSLYAPLTPSDRKELEKSTKTLLQASGYIK